MLCKVLDLMVTMAGRRKPPGAKPSWHVLCVPACILASFHLSSLIFTVALCDRHSLSTLRVRNLRVLNCLPHSTWLLSRKQTPQYLIHFTIAIPKNRGGWAGHRSEQRVWLSEYGRGGNVKFPIVLAEIYLKALKL